MTNKNGKLKQKTCTNDKEKNVDDQYINDVISIIFIRKFF